MAVGLPRVYLWVQRWQWGSPGWIFVFRDGSGAPQDGFVGSETAVGLPKVNLCVQGWQWGSQCGFVYSRIAVGLPKVDLGFQGWQ